MKCKKCGKELPLDNFYKSKNTKDGYEGKCKENKPPEPKEADVDDSTNKQ